MDLSKIVLVFLLFGVHWCKISKRRYVLEKHNLWSACSLTCGYGIRYMLSICVQKTFYGTSEQVDDDLCGSALVASDRIVEACFYGYCPDRDNDEYVWKVSEWSKCSKSCGGGSIRTREVICMLVLKSGNRLEASYSNCIANVEPHRLEKCALTDCPPEFVTTPWDKCTNIRECRPGIRRRKIKCIVTLGNTKSTEISAGYCYRRTRPPIEWEYCMNDPVFQEKCRFRREVERNRIPSIVTSLSTVHQMRSVKKLRLIAGQRAYVLPHTSLVIKCQVKNYPSSNIQWKRNDATLRYIGKVDSRVSVTHRGTLIMKTFLVSDQGQWRCIARNISAATYLFLKSASEGFEQWLSRNLYRKESIVRINSDINFIKSVYYQWVASSWSSCTKTCGDIGFQSRRVSCEELEPQYFVEVDDRLCDNQKSQKPETIRKCNGVKYCPQWTIPKLEHSKCSNNCIDIHSALFDTPVVCKLGDRILPDNGCSKEIRPSANCFNPNCDVYWNIGPWSKCSKSCGSFGFIYRIISCHWKMDNRSAGSICYKKSLKTPSVIKACSPPPCLLGCMDLSKYCGIKKLCGLSRYRFYCCRTCYQN